MTAVGRLEYRQITLNLELDKYESVIDSLKREDSTRSTTNEAVVHTNKYLLISDSDLFLRHDALMFDEICSTSPGQLSRPEL